jgi:hypothetical protein
MGCHVVRALVAAFVVLAGFPLAVAATLIVPVSQTRSVTAFADADPGDPSFSSFSAADFGTFDQTASATSFYPGSPVWRISNSVRQTSTIEDARLTAALSGSFTWQVVGGTTYTQSIFDVTFDLTALANYQLGNGQVAYQFGEGTHVVTLRDANGQVIAQPPWNYYPPGSTDPLVGWLSVSSGVLQPGRYRLTAQWDRGFPGDSGEWNAAAVLSLTEIPEPGTGLLVIAGLLGFAGWRRN